MFQPFYIGTESIEIDDLTLENGVDVINLYGQIQFHQDRQSLEKAKELQLLFNQLVQQLEILQQQGQLPEKFEYSSCTIVSNPFLSNCDD